MQTLTALVVVLAQAVAEVPVLPAPVCAETSVIHAEQVAGCSGFLVPRPSLEEALICKNVTVPQLENDLKRRTDLAVIAQQQASQNLAFRDKLIDQLIQQPRTSSLSAWDVIALFSAGLVTGIIISVNLQ